LELARYIGLLQMHMTYNVAVRHLKQEISHSQLLSMPIQTHPLIESNNFASII